SRHGSLQEATARLWKDLRAVTVFHLLRHGEHVLRGRVLAGRTPGVGLSARGRAEIAAVADRLAEEQIAALSSSPLQRARETAEILAGRLDLPIEYREDVLELDFGEWTGLTFDAVRTDERWRLWSTCRSIACVPAARACARCRSGLSKPYSNCAK